MLSRHYVVPLTHLRTQHVGLHEAPWRKTAVKSKAVSDLGGVNPPLVVRFVRGCTFLKQFGIQRLSPGVYQSLANLRGLLGFIPIFGEVQPSRCSSSKRSKRARLLPEIPGCTVRVAGQVRSTDAGRGPGDSYKRLMNGFMALSPDMEFFWDLTAFIFTIFPNFSGEHDDEPLNLGYHYFQANPSIIAVKLQDVHWLLHLWKWSIVTAGCDVPGIWLWSNAQFAKVQWSSWGLYQDGVSILLPFFMGQMLF